MKKNERITTIVCNGKKHNVYTKSQKIFACVLVSLVMVCMAVAGTIAGHGYVSSAERIRIAYNSIAIGTPYHIATENLNQSEMDNLNGMLNRKPVKVYVNG